MEIETHKYTCFTSLVRISCAEDEKVIEIKQCDPPLFHIRYNAFKDLKHVEKIIIPDTVMVIEFHAFKGCENLRTITCDPNSGDVSIFPQDLRMVESGAFSGTKLESVKFLTREEMELQDGVFQDCIHLKSVSFDTRHLYFGKEAFMGCSSLKTFFAPFAYADIPDRMFKGCSDLKVVNADILDVGSEAFAGCSRLATLRISKYSEVRYRAFERCTKLVVKPFKRKTNY